MRTVITLHSPGSKTGPALDQIVLAHDERRLRRKLLRTRKGLEMMIDLPQTTTLEHGQLLELDDGSLVEIVAAEEHLYAVTARDTAHLVRLAWHIGNRHTSAQLDADRILIKRDHVLKAMLEGLGAKVTDTVEPFYAEHGAYHAHAHADAGHALLARP
jgi:urease accessory protein